MKAVNFVIVTLCVACIVADPEIGDVELLGSKEIDVAPRIVGGKDAKEGQFPYQVSLRTRLTKQHFCGGSIVSNHYILTAAHCTQGLTSIPLFVVARIGSIHRLEGGVTMKIQRITPHEKYDSSKLLNDISLLRTRADIIFTDFIQPIALPSADVPDNTQVIVSGWGLRRYPGIILPKILQFIEPNTLSHNDCLEQFKDTDGFDILHKTHLCTTNAKSTGACQGDSGGPLVDASNPEKKTLIGVVSWGMIPCASGYPDVYTRVFSFNNWINDKISA